jgi:hypothetical protein
MKHAVLGIWLVTIALGACRREQPEYQPMKLGATTHTSAHK